MPNGNVRKRRQSRIADAKSPAAWVDREVADCEFRDERLGKRFRSLLEQLSSSPGDSIPLVCQDWANTKATYRFLDNERVSEAEILGGHFQATRDRVSATDGPILVMHDTTEFTYKREDVEAIGKTRINIAGAYRDGTPRYLTACGILMHSSLAVTADGLPLGLAAIKFWSRKKFKGANALKKKINPTRVPIEEKESIRWLDNLKQATDLLGDAARCVHIGDRESDIYELFCAAQDAGTKFRCTELRCVIVTATYPKLSLNCDSGASSYSRHCTNRGAILHSNSRCYMRPSVANHPVVTRLTGS